VAEKKVIDVAHVTVRGSSLRITIPKKVAKEYLELGDGDIMVFYKENGRIFLDKLRV